MIAALTAALTLTFWVSLLIVILLWRHAEAERGRTEAELNFASLLLDEFSRLGPAGSTEILGLHPDKIISLFKITRNHIFRHRAEHPEDLEIIRQLARVDYSLASCFADQNQFDISCSLLAECMENADRVLQRRPHDALCLFHRFKAYMALASVADQEGKSEESVRHLEQAVTHGQECLRHKDDRDLIDTAGLIDELAETRRSLARSFDRQGNYARARSLIADNFRMLDEVPGDVPNPLIAIQRTLVRLDLHEFKTCISSVPPSRTGEPDPSACLASSEAETLDNDS
jgi:tetratricopeptide (TPR) repeat protein